MKLGTAVAAAQAAEAAEVASTVPLRAFCLVGSFWRAPPSVELEPLIEGSF